MKNKKIYLTLVFLLLCSKLFYGQEMYGNNIKSSYYGDEFTFNVNIKSTNSTNRESFNVYLKLFMPDGVDRIYQLDYVQQSKNNQKNILYSCILTLDQIGMYQAIYFCETTNKKRLTDYKVYKFKVWHEVYW